LNTEAIAQSTIYYMEGYLAASPTGLDAALQGLRAARQHSVQTALTLSDVSMVGFCREGLATMQEGGLDYLFANEAEALAWSQAPDFESALPPLSALARTVCITRGPLGCVLLQGDKRWNMPAVPTQAVDTNGAGDMFAGSFLFGMTHGMSLPQAAAFANRAAAAVVSQHGNRLNTSHMRTLLTQAPR
jgi:sugar/nucleoside kinase (ribokinase family)